MYPLRQFKNLDLYTYNINANLRISLIPINILTYKFSTNLYTYV